MLLYSTSMYDHFCYCLLGQVGSWGPWGVTAVPLKHRSAGTEFSVLPGGLCSREKFYLGFFPLLFFFSFLVFWTALGWILQCLPSGTAASGRMGWPCSRPSFSIPKTRTGQRAKSTEPEMLHPTASIVFCHKFYPLDLDNTSQSPSCWRDKCRGKEADSIFPLVF